MRPGAIAAVAFGVVACGARHAQRVVAPGEPAADVACVVRIDFEQKDWMGARKAAHEWLGFDRSGHLRTVVASSADEVPRSRATFARDAAGRLIRWSRQFLDERGQRTPNEQSVDYLRDASGRLLAERGSHQQTRGGSTGGCEPRDDGPPRIESFAFEMTYGYDERGRLVDVTGRETSGRRMPRWTYRYAGDHLVEVTDASSEPASSYRFERDARGRIVAIVAPWGRGVRVWRGDHVSEERWESPALGSGATRWRWNRDRLEEFETSREVRRFRYDDDGRIVRIESRTSDPGGQTNEDAFTLVYDRACPERPLLSARPTELGHIGADEETNGPRNSTTIYSRLDVN